LQSRALRRRWIGQRWLGGRERGRGGGEVRWRRSRFVIGTTIYAAGEARVEGSEARSDALPPAAPGKE